MTQVSADTAVVTTKANLQSGTSPQICTSASADGTNYTAACATTLLAYATKQTLYWYADAANTTATPTLNIDTLGAKFLVKQDGTALANGNIAAGTLYRIWYDGTSFRVVEAGLGTAIASGTSSSLYLGWITTPIALTSGSDVLVASTGVLPALSAGHCYDWELVGLLDGNSSMKLWYGSNPGTTGDALDITPGIFTGANWTRGQVCTLPGSQSSEVLTAFPAYNNYSGGFAYTGKASQDTSLSNLRIGVTVNALYATHYTTYKFRVWQEQ